MLDPWLLVLITSATSIAASSGFWAYLARRSEKNSASTRLLMGLGYDKLILLGMRYIDRGEITRDEYEDFRKYFYEPYKELGGNGVAERIMEEVKGLRLRSSSHYVPIDQVQRLNSESINER